MIYIEFLILATIIVCGSILLSKQANIIEENSKLNAVFIGSMLALATSLPELATSLTSTLIGSSAMSISNILGSNIFNIMILAIMNIIFFNKVVYSKIKSSTNKINLFSLLIYASLSITIVFDPKIFIINNVNITSFVIIIIYALALKNTSQDDELNTDNKNKDSNLLKRATITFIITAIVILITSIELSKVAQLIMIQSGLSASFVGAVFIGISTSLPELITCFTLISIGSYNMAASGVLSSNLFNFLILAIVDIIDKGSLYSSSDNGTIVLLSLGTLFTTLTIASISSKFKNKFTNILIPIIIVSLYLYLLF